MTNVAVYACTPGHGYSRVATVKMVARQYIPHPAKAKGPFVCPRKSIITTTSRLPYSATGTKQLIMHVSPKSLTPRNQYLSTISPQPRQPVPRRPPPAHLTFFHTRHSAVNSVVGPSRPATGREPMTSPDTGLPRPAWPARADGGGGSDPLYRFLFADLSVDTVKAG
jgi:hypothetical protein